MRTFYLAVPLVLAATALSDHIAQKPDLDDVHTVFIQPTAGFSDPRAEFTKVCHSLSANPTWTGPTLTNSYYARCDQGRGTGQIHHVVQAALYLQTKGWKICSWYFDGGLQKEDPTC